MSVTKHTPGPWVATRKNRVATPTGTIIAQGYTTPHKMNAAAREISAVTSNANARLMAAAPDLLEALEGMVEHYTALVNSGDAGNWNPETEAPVIASRAALAKAVAE